MAVWTCSASRTAHEGDDFSLLNKIARFNEKAATVGVTGCTTVRMPDFHQIAIATTVPACKDYLSDRTRHDRRSGWCCNVDALMQPTPPPAVARGERSVRWVNEGWIGVDRISRWDA